MNKERYWAVYHNADLTETGRLRNKTYIKTVWGGFPAQQSAEREILEDFCFKRFGSKVVYVQGVAATAGWALHESTVDEFEAARPLKWGGYTTKTEQLTLGIGTPEVQVYHAIR